ncbi:MAG: ABC transporter ATP-binding protein [Acuticoccus sp.]
MTILSVQNLSVGFPTSGGLVPAVENLSFDIAQGETLAIVGESGSGKSTAALALNQLLPRASRPEVTGRALFDGEDLLALPPRMIRSIRGRRIGMIFQDPSTTLNPVFTIGRQIMEPLKIHQRLGHKAATARALELLRLVRVSAPEKRLSQFPHNLSGGMRQRVMIAIALACNPDLLIADEPTTALDVTVQAQVLRLIEELKTSLGMAVLLITHDLGVVWETADRIVVMYAGRKVEDGPVQEILSRPAHPYTAGLLRAARKEGENRTLYAIDGTVPAPLAKPAGCAFAPRCDLTIDACRQGVPPRRVVGPAHGAACIRTAEETIA